MSDCPLWSTFLFTIRWSDDIQHSAKWSARPVSAQQPSDNCWKHTFSLPISTFSALGVSHVMHYYINLCYLLTYQILSYRHIFTSLILLVKPTDHWSQILSWTCRFYYPLFQPGHKTLFATHKKVMSRSLQVCNPVCDQDRIVDCELLGSSKGIWFVKIQLQ